ncbi:MAG: preprotein translocase subunit SecG [Planctomycetaceae bacterium]|nr:preprotein translocase subunit SecG [Planctomycetaceae bacterium]
MAILTQVLLLFLGMFLMIVVLLQRGRGGGLAGAFGGMGGQSAFGTKAGDVFTKITVVIAVAWVLVAGGSGYFLRAGAESRSEGLPDTFESPVDESPIGGESTSGPIDFSPADLDGLGDEAPATDDSPADSDAEEPSAETPAEESTDAPADDAAPESTETENEGTDETTE